MTLHDKQVKPENSFSSYSIFNYSNNNLTVHVLEMLLSLTRSQVQLKVSLKSAI